MIIRILSILILQFFIVSSVNISQAFANNNFEKTVQVRGQNLALKTNLGAGADKTHVVIKGVGERLGAKGRIGNLKDGAGNQLERVKSGVTDKFSKVKKKAVEVTKEKFENKDRALSNKYLKYISLTGSGVFAVAGVAAIVVGVVLGGNFLLYITLPGALVLLASIVVGAVLFWLFSGEQADSQVSDKKDTAVETSSDKKEPAQEPVKGDKRKDLGAEAAGKVLKVLSSKTLKYSVMAGLGLISVCCIIGIIAGVALGGNFLLYFTLPGGILLVTSVVLAGVSFVVFGKNSKEKQDQKEGQKQPDLTVVKPTERVESQEAAKPVEVDSSVDVQAVPEPVIEEVAEEEVVPAPVIVVPVKSAPTPIPASAPIDDIKSEQEKEFEQKKQQLVVFISKLENVKDKKILNDVRVYYAGNYISIFEVLNTIKNDSVILDTRLDLAKSAIKIVNNVSENKGNPLSEIVEVAVAKVEIDLAEKIAALKKAVEELSGKLQTALTEADGLLKDVYVETDAGAVLINEVVNANLASLPEDEDGLNKFLELADKVRGVINNIASNKDEVLAEIVVFVESVVETEDELKLKAKKDALDELVGKLSAVK
ncbi:hypothetical protein KKC59_03165, partial [bacterium]|nr:hypothetical protein [bacterium]